MTLEAVLECSSVQADDYAWHDFLTERDFRPEDLWEFDCEAQAAESAFSPEQHGTDSSSDPTEPCGAASSFGERQVTAERQVRVQPSQWVWELAAPVADDGADGDSADDDGADDDGADDDGADERGAHGDGDGDWAHGDRRGDEDRADADSDSRADEDRPDDDRADSDRTCLDMRAGLRGRAVLTGLENLTLQDASAALKDLAGLRSWVDAMEARIVSRLADLTRDDLPPRFPTGASRDNMARSVAASEVALTLNLPERTASRLVDESTHLTMRHGATLEALELGSISRRHAVLIAEESLGMPPEAVAGFERALLDQAPSMTVAKLARRARRLRESHHPETLPVRRAKAVAERHVELRPDDDGMAWLHAYLPAEQACGVYQRLTATAQKLKAPDESRTLTQLRADVFTDLLTHSCIPGDVPVLSGDGNSDGNQRNCKDTDGAGGGSGRSKEPAWHGITAHVNITVPVLALLDVLNPVGKNNAACSNPVGKNKSAGSNPVGKHNPAGSNPGGSKNPAGSNRVGKNNSVADNHPGGLNQFAELDGYGPIDAETAARLAAHAPSFTRILTHPVSGSVLDVGRETYRPPKHLQDWVRARDRTCRHPGCNRAAAACEIDHSVPWSQGGRTSHRNLACFCPKHHMYKSEGIFRYRQPTPGTIVVRSRSGTLRTSTPDPPF